VTAWRDPFEFPDAAGWRHGRNLSHLIFHNFKKTQATPRLPAPFFLIDSFPQHLLSDFGGFCGKMSKKIRLFRASGAVLPDFFEKSKKILKPRGKWYAARAPPPLRESKTYPTFKFSEVTRCVIKRKKFF
jgi:hypothetical protein